MATRLAWQVCLTRPDGSEAVGRVVAPQRVCGGACTFRQWQSDRTHRLTETHLILHFDPASSGLLSRALC